MNTPLCSLCPRIRPPVRPTGPIPCRVLLLGECPAESEDKYHEPFIGYTGKDLDAVYLPLANLPRSEVHIANAVWCSRLDYSNPTNDDATICSSTHLGPLLSQVRPIVLVPMGAVACSLSPVVGRRGGG